jgi:hypothetical protein
LRNPPQISSSKRGYHHGLNKPQSDGGYPYCIKPKATAINLKNMLENIVETTEEDSYIIILML